MGVLDRLKFIETIAIELANQLEFETMKRFLVEFQIPERSGFSGSIKDYIIYRIQDAQMPVLTEMAKELGIDTKLAKPKQPLVGLAGYTENLKKQSRISKLAPAEIVTPPSAKPREPFRPVSDFATAPAVKPTTSLPIKSNNNSIIVKVFISHSTENKQYANTLRKVFKGYDIIAFVSGEDIKGGEVWQERIKKEINEMHVFIAMHTDDFSKSLWCQQETGLALARETEVEIIPINFNKGKPLDSFLTNFQYIKRGAKSTAKVVKEILDRLKTSDKTKELYFAKIADKVKEAVKKESGQLDKKLKPYQYANLNNPSGVFLSIFIDVEVLLRNTHLLYFGDRGRHPGNPQSIVNDFFIKGVFSRELVNNFETAIRLRNKIAHGEKISNKPYEIELFSKTLLLLKEKLTNIIRNHEKRQLSDPLPGKKRQLDDPL